MHRVPYVLIFTRVLIGIGIIFISSAHPEHYTLIAIALLTIGLLSDVFDGIIARRLNISTRQLRRWDSAADQLFFIGFSIATYIHCPGFLKQIC